MPGVDNKSISSWVRQARHRAKKHNIQSDLEVDDIQQLLQQSKLCSYCKSLAESIDCPFPLKNGGPNVPANVVLCCRKCKAIKNNRDIVWFFSHGHIDKDIYLALIQELCARRGGKVIRDHMRIATGIIGQGDE